VKSYRYLHNISKKVNWIINDYLSREPPGSDSASVEEIHHCSTVILCQESRLSVYVGCDKCTALRPLSNYQGLYITSKAG
jgi:hypothetical protein